MTKDTASATKTLRAGSKAATLLEMLQRKEGASLDEMTERTGWHPRGRRDRKRGRL
jgi:hypothetical protein